MPTPTTREPAADRADQTGVHAQGLNTDFVDAQGDTPLAQQWTALHYGDYVAYYLAMLYEIDPTPIKALEGFKQQLSER